MKIEKYNINYEFNEYPEAHGVSNQNLNDIINWLSNWNYFQIIVSKVYTHW